jgi:hypothetical protein
MVNVTSRVISKITIFTPTVLSAKEICPTEQQFMITVTLRMKNDAL